MSKKKAAGLALVALSILLFAVVILSVGASLPDSGPWMGKITQYRAPFPGHGLLMVLLGILSAASFLSGVILIVIGRVE